MKRLALGLLACAALAWACGSPPPSKPAMKADEPSPSEVADDPDASEKAWAHEEADAGAAAPASSAAASTGDETGAKSLLAQFVAPNADHAALTKSLKPTSADYKAIFDPATAPKIETAQAKDWESGKAAIKPGDGQTEVKISSATGADLASGKGAAKDFPGGYRKLAKHIVPTATIFRFKFVKPGEDNGTAYDGLAFVNNHWVIAPKPFRALEGKSSGLDEAPAEEPAAKPAKGGKKPTKPKGKKK